MGCANLTRAGHSQKTSDWARRGLVREGAKMLMISKNPKFQQVIEPRRVKLITSFTITITIVIKERNFSTFTLKCNGKYSI